MAFRGCESLQSIEIPPSVEKIEHHTFWNCTNLKSVSIPQSVKEIGENAFFGCDMLDEETKSRIVEILGNKYREELLRKKVNKFFVDGMKLEEKDYYSQLEQENKLMKMKNVFSAVNNVITYKCTLAAAKWLGDIFPSLKTDEMEAKINSVNSNTNGYDIEWNEGEKIIAEVKCNNPLETKNIFSTSQKNAIINDLNNLKGDENGEGKKGLETKGYYRFMFFADDGEHVKEAIDNFVTEKRKEKFKLEILDSNSNIKLDKNHIYIKLIDLYKQP